MVSTRACLAALAALFAISLGGCNLVVSEKPMFSPADARGAPVLRPGIWASPNDDCVFDDKTPVAGWPDCANGSVITTNEVRSPKDPSKNGPYLLVSGDPLVMQARVVLEGDLKPKSGAPTNLYFYLGIQPVAFDERHRITSLQAWFIQCGPPPKAAPKPDQRANGRAYATDHPLPGMTILDTGMCEPANGAAVRRAAGVSEPWGRPHLATHWVRDGDK